MIVNKPIRAKVDAAGLLPKIDRMFDAAPVTVFSELLQNSRRAGATQVSIVIGDHVVYEDNGRGVEDPQILLDLAAKGWGDDIQRDEDAAGMGFFCLSGFEEVYVESRAWHGTLTPQVFRGEVEFDIHTRPPEEVSNSGFRVIWRWPLMQAVDLSAAAQRAAAYCGIELVTITTAGGVAVMPAKDFLEDCSVTEYHALGVRIGVVDDRDPYRRCPQMRVNFKGVLIVEDVEMPTHEMVGHGKFGRYVVRVDVEHARGLAMVLPARNALIRGPARDALLQACVLEVLKFLASTSYGDHMFSYDVYAAARAMGVDIGEARRHLTCACDSNAPETTPWILLPVCYDNVAASLVDDEFGRLMWPDERMRGYSWYDALPEVSAVTVDLGQGPVDVTRSPVMDRDDATGPFTKVPRIDLRVAVDGREWSKSMKCLAVVNGKDAYACNVGEDQEIFVAETIDASDVEDIVDYLEHAVFDASDDSEADSWETQQDNFRDELTGMVTKFVGGSDAALRVEILRLLNSHWAGYSRDVRWRISREFGGEIDIEYAEVRKGVA
jgi:hypothetical protein